MIGHLASVVLAEAMVVALSRLLRVRLSRAVVTAGILLPHLVLLPWYVNDVLVFPGALIPMNFPGAPNVKADRSHDDLSDVVNELVPWEIDVRRALGAARVPLWTDTIDGGSSPWVNPQAGVLSPVAMLSRLVSVQNSLQTSVILKMLIALQGMWLLGRLLGGTRNASLIAGCGYALGGGIMAWAVFPLSSTLAWSPWLVAAFLRITRRPSYRAVIAGALCTAAIALSGHPETAFMSALLAAICGISLMPKGRGRIRRVATAGLAAALGIGLAAPQVIPILWAAHNSERSQHMKNQRGPTKEPMWSDPLTWCQGHQILIAAQPANPRALGTPYRDDAPPPHPWPIPASLYSGLLVFAGALAGLGARRRALIPFAAFAVVGLILAVKFIVIERVRLQVPLLELIEANRVLPIVSLCLCAAAVLGLSKIMGGGLRRGSAIAVAIAAATSLALARPPWVVALWAAILVATFFLRARPRWMMLVLGLVLLVDLVPWARMMLPVGPRELFYPVTPTVTGLREMTKGDEPWRVVAQGSRPIASTLSVHGLEDIRYHNPMVPRSYADLLQRVFNYDQHAGPNKNKFRGVEHPLLDFLNVRGVVWVRNKVVPRPQGMQKVATVVDGRVLLFRNRNALPRFFLPPEVTVVPSREVVDTIAGMTDGRRVVLSAEEVRDWRPPARGWAPRAVKVERLIPGRIVLRVPRAHEKLLASSLLVPEGWRAVGDGRTLRTLTVNDAFLGVVIPEGVSRVRLDFTPPGLYLGVALFVLSLIFLAGLGVLTTGPISRR